MTKRFLSIEVLKGLGIIYLIALHTWVWIYLDLSVLELRYPQMQTTFPLFGYFGLHVLGFQVPMLAGITFYLSTHFKKTPWMLVYQRALLLMAMGFGVNFLCWGTYGVLDWDVLQFLGLCMIASLPLLRWFPTGINVFVSVGIGVVCLLFSSQFPLEHLSDQYWYAILIGSPGGEHFWAFCPWYFIFSFGLLCGYVLSQKSIIYRKVLLVTGIIFFVSSLVTGKFHPVVTTALWGTDMFKPSAFYVLGIVGLTVIMMFLLEYAFKCNAKFKQIMQASFVVTLGRSILWVYLFNLVIGYHATRWVLKEYDPTMGQSVIAFLGLVGGTLVIGYLIAHGVGQAREVEYE